MSYQERINNFGWGLSFNHGSCCCCREETPGLKFFHQFCETKGFFRGVKDFNTFCLTHSNEILDGIKCSSDRWRGRVPIVVEVVQVEFGDDPTPPTIEILPKPHDGETRDQLSVLSEIFPILIKNIPLRESLKRRHPMYSRLVGLEKDMMIISWRFPE